MKFLERYFALYLDVLKRRNKIIKILTVVFSSAGVLGWPVWDYAPLIGAMLSASVQIFSLVQDQIIMSDKDMRMICINLFNQLERLWIEQYNERINDQATAERFYEIRLAVADMYKIENEINLPIRNKLKNVANGQAEQYLDVFFISASSETTLSEEDIQD